MIALPLALIDPDPHSVCKRAGSEHEFRICAQEDYAAADRKLNVQWRRTLVAVKRDGSRYPKTKARIRQLIDLARNPEHPEDPL